MWNVTFHMILKPKSSFFVPHDNNSYINKSIRGKDNVSNLGDLTILHQNIAGLCNKLEVIELALAELSENGHEIDVLCFSETYVKQGTETNV